MQYITTQPIGDIAPGTIVDPGAWTNLDDLVRLRMLRPATDYEVERATGVNPQREAGSRIEAMSDRLAELGATVDKLTRRVAALETRGQGRK